MLQKFAIKVFFMLALIVRAGNGDSIAHLQLADYQNDTVTIADNPAPSVHGSRASFASSISLVNITKDRTRYMGGDCSFNNTLSFQCRISPVYTSDPSTGHYRSFTASHSVYSFKLRGPPALA